MRAFRAPFIAAGLALCIAAAPGSVVAQSGDALAPQAPVVLDAQTLLYQGDAEPAYFRSAEMMEATGETAELHIIAAKAAFLKAKSSALLRKKRWAKRGRDHYKTALALDGESADALLGLATFAVRAPTKLGGGDTAAAEYAGRLSAVSPSLYNVFQARTAREAKQLNSALDFYEASFAMSEQALFEYVEIAEKNKLEQRAYKAIASSGVSSEPCASYALGRLARGVSAAGAFEHYDAFLQSGERFCDRRYVAIDAVDAAIDLVQGTLNGQRIAEFQRLKETFEAEREGGKTKGSAAS